MSIIRRVTESGPYQWLAEHPIWLDVVTVVTMAVILVSFRGGWIGTAPWYVFEALAFVWAIVLGSLLARYPAPDRVYVWHQNLLMAVPAYLLFISAPFSPIPGGPLVSMHVWFSVWLAALVVFHLVAGPAISAAQEEAK